MQKTNAKRVQILERSFTILEEVIRNCLLDTEEQTRKAIEKDIKYRIKYAEDDIELLAIKDAFLKLCDLSFEEMCEMADIIEEDSELEEDGEDVSELFKEFIATREDETFSFVDIDNTEKTYQLMARLSLKDGYYALLFPLHKLPDGEVPISKYYKFIFSDGVTPDHFEEVTDEKVLKQLHHILFD